MGARLTSGAIGMGSGLMIKLSRPSEMLPTAPSSAAAAVTAAAGKFEKKVRARTVSRDTANADSGPRSVVYALWLATSETPECLSRAPARGDRCYPNKTHL